jgi:WD40 repeat protein
MNNVVIRDLKNPEKSLIFTEYLNKVTSVKYSPNGNLIASGDEKGKLKIFQYNEASNDFLVKKEHSLLMGAVKELAWTDDNQRVCGVGEGKDFFAKVVIQDTGNKVGDLNGPSKILLTVDIKQKPYRLAIAGEN